MMDTHKYNLVMETDESTVVSEYVSPYKKSSTYQSEAELEQSLIKQLKSQAYEYITITSETELIANLRQQLEKLNNYIFSDTEWERFFTTYLANANEEIVEKTNTIQEDYIKNMVRDDGSIKNIKLIDKKNIHNNILQVINQYEASGTYDNRYDVTILVNGLPLVHIELKRRGVDIKEAFNQINRYQRESFWSGNKLFQYVQLFIISNGTLTKYYSNTTRYQAKKENDGTANRKSKKTSNSFEFTSWWADAKNNPITDLTDFTATFLAKHTLLNILTKYCVFTSDKLLLVMRPYQIVATERILNRIQISTNYKKLGTIEAGGYIWHTTGSGKTLTSFKTAQLASKLDYIDKVLFVVDRKDLDYQTMKEYDKFEKGAANSNTSTAKLTKQLSDVNTKIIITTIQKLDRFIKKNTGHQVLDEHLVLIFDECHRSQFGDMHQAITSSFKNYHLFGFTGTPIFAKNSSSIGSPNFRTTEQVFGEQLHNYTIVNAINDKNVLPFRVDYIRTIREAENIQDGQVRDIDRERVLNAPERIENIVKYIRDHFNQKTKRNSQPYTFTRLANIQEAANAKDRRAIEEIKEKIRLSGFNSILATSSIESAKLYYSEFKKQQLDIPAVERLKVAIIFSYNANESDELDGIEDENNDGTDGLDAPSRDFLENAIQDYNNIFKTNYDTSSDKFQNYYKDVSLRVKNREVDLLIVVNMFLTGFDATTLNTLWVDKNLRMHGLLQAYSRTNRILNSVKTYGNIVTFRNLEQATNEALSLFGDKNASGIVLLKTFHEYYYGYQQDGEEIQGYLDLINELQNRFPLNQQIIGENNKKDFIKLYGAILRARNVLSSFDDFLGNEILSEREIQDYHSIYIDLYAEFRSTEQAGREDINDDIIFEMELIKQVEINIDYILELIRKFHSSNQNDKEILIDINKAINSSVELRNKKDLIEQFIKSLNISTDIDEDWKTFVDKKRLEELEQIIIEENLDPDKTYEFINNAFKDGVIQTTGTAVANILPYISRFSPDRARSKKRETVLEKLQKFFNKFFDISHGNIH